MSKRISSVRTARADVVTIDHRLSVPIDHRQPGGEQLSLFAREVVKPELESAPLPYLLWLQGGPGNAATRPAELPGWLSATMATHRVVLLDQRGTGASSALTRQTLPGHGDPARQAHLLGLHRADAIVADAELLRQQLIGDTPWAVLGQSFGGFCAVHYLTAAPEGLTAALLTGGLPPLVTSPDPVYRATYRRVLEANARFFDSFPGDRETAARVAAHLAVTPEHLPTGERLTPQRFQTLGMLLGAAKKINELHYVLEDPFAGNRLSDAFLAAIAPNLSFAVHPLYAVLHESIYCSGTASNWSAHRIRAEFGDAFDAGRDEFNFTGEMIYPWMFDQDPSLRPLTEAAELVAQRTDLSRLYDPELLAANRIPVAAALYPDDMFVDAELSRATAASIGNCRVWEAADYLHDGIRADGAAIVGRLMDMVRR